MSNPFLPIKQDIEKVITIKLEIKQIEDRLADEMKVINEARNALKNRKDDLKKIEERVATYVMDVNRKSDYNFTTIQVPSLGYEIQFKPKKQITAATKVKPTKQTLQTAINQVLTPKERELVEQVAMDQERNRVATRAMNDTNLLNVQICKMKN